MRILVTNDDGVGAPGINCLASVLGAEHDVFVVAPDRERSGVGHAFTLDKPLRADPVPEVFPEGLVKGAWQCTGTPVDCVKMGVLVLLADQPPDLVVSGINRGSNLSVDHLYSGTVGGALEAAIMGLPSVAVSVEVTRGQHHHFETAAEFVRRFLADDETRSLLTPGTAFNINAPGRPTDEVKGFRFTCVGRCVYHDRYHDHQDPHGRPYYWLEGEPEILDDRPWADVVAVREGYVSVTPLTPDLTNHVLLETLRARRS